ncbi:MupA/Atu3671 family FMN-dependent luciferase-like monooxygenase [Lutimaribacter marinistellae]|uniref:MupA/Atu3671 family FMN-dependent luciferase-like monooxygenase n=1 Tax=Lutimaribacter marinistellae TaxID=1820329 RepID=A0ABV7TG62_9RHOB
MSFSCVLIGQESLLVGCGEALLDAGHEIRAVVSPDDEIRSWARAKAIPTSARIADLSAQFAPGGFDWLLSIANLSVIPESVLALPARGAVNFHDGPLPRYAGLNTPVWALLAGEAQHGVTWHMIEGGIDEGDILAQKMVEIADDETAFSLNSKCYAAAMDSFPAVMEQLETGLQRQAQDLGQRSYFARDDRPEGFARLDLHKPAGTLARQVRALDFGGYWNPLACAKVDTGHGPLRVSGAEVAGRSGALPGTVIAVEGDTMVVATGDGDLRLTGLTDLGGAPAAMPAPDTRLPGIDAEETKALDSLQARIAKGEPAWRRALKACRPLPVPLALRGAPGGWSAQRISVPYGLDADALRAAALVWALRGSGEEHGDVALTTPALQAEAKTGYTAPWVPVQVALSNSLHELGETLKTAEARLQSAGSFAWDLIARDPSVTLEGTPPVALAMDGSGPVEDAIVTLAVKDGAATLHLRDGLIDDRTAEILARRLECVLQSVASAGVSATVQEIDALPASERGQTVAEWNRSARDYDRGQMIHEAFEAQAAKSPDSTALVFEGEELSYADLNTRANSVAERLRAMGVGPGAHVGLYIDRSIELITGALAILKAGGAYVPLDPAYPADRIAHYIADSEAAVILTHSAMAKDLPDGNADIVAIDTIATDPAAQDTDSGATADDLAYVIYTSGSTGTPKGVMVEHRNVANFFAGMDDRIDHAGGGVWLAVTSLNFDISVLEIFWTLARGFKVVLSSGENRAEVSKGPIAISDRPIDFNLMYWGNDDGPGPKKYELLLEGAKFAAANGFNAVWTPERHFHAFGGPYPNPAVTGAAVAAVAPNLSVRAGSCVAPLHHPARIAEDWAVIDNLTGGRTGIGFASGWQPDDFVLRPENAPPNNKPAMFEAIETVRKLWRGEAVGFARADGSIHEVVTQPRPVSKELDVWVTTAGNPETWREAGRVGANVLTHLLGQSIAEVGEKIRIYHAALREAGHDPADFRVTLMLHSYLADTREDARRIAREPMKDYLRSAAGLIKQYAWAFPAFKKPKGVSNPFEMDLGSLSGEELEAILDFAFERYFEESGLFGTVEDGIARVEALKRIGVDEVACLIDYGIDPVQVLEGLKPLAEVLARVNAPSSLAADDFSLAAQIIRHGVTHLQCTPSMARMIAMNDEARMALGRVQTLLLGGEALPGELVEDLRECTGARVLNMYGPTETTIWSTCAEVPAGARGTVDVGTPIANTAVYVLDQAGAPCPIGVPGELFIGGEGVTRGYWKREALTAERFVPDPFAAEAGLTVTAAPMMYRTGDLVRWRPDGRLDFLGRTDHQVKIRGQRIELGEIETAMVGFPGVSGAVVVAREMTPGDLRLVGYVTTQGPVSDAALRAHLAAQLPEAMVPAHIVTLDAFPLTPNKKIDRKALPEPMPARFEKAEPTAAPKGGVEAEIAAIWSRILGVGAVGPQDNFFALGGHSLLAVQAHREIRTALDAPRLSITDIFRFPTLAGLAAHLSDGESPQEDTPKVDAPERSETMSKRRAMRANRRERT